jgi:hypothetical protein
LVLSKLEREAPANFQRVKGVVGRDAAEHAYFARRASMSAPARHTLAMDEDQAPARSMGDRAAPASVKAA